MNSVPKAVKPAVWARSAVLGSNGNAPPRRRRGFLRATCFLVFRPSTDVARRSATNSFIIFFVGRSELAIDDTPVPPHRARKWREQFEKIC